MTKKLLIPILLCVTAGCSKGLPQLSHVELFLDAPAGVRTRSASPDAYIITDFNLLIFNDSGVLEEKRYVPSRAMAPTSEGVSHRTTLLKGVTYTVLAAANIGYELPAMNLEEALAYRYFLAYPDEFSKGIPMAVRQEITARDEVHISFERLMAMADVTVDLSHLDGTVSIEVQEMSIGDCPSSALLFSGSVRTPADTHFARGYSRAPEGGSASLYLLESLGENPGPYVEIKARYYSQKWHTMPGGHLKYRFYLGEDDDDYNVVRNGHYRITVIPKGDGLSGGDGWSVDRSELVYGP